LDTLIAKEKDARAKQKSAAPGLAADRARFALADLLDQIVDCSERLSIALEKTGEKAKAADFAQGALDSARAERETLKATGDLYGAAVAELRGLIARETRLADRVKALRG